MHSMEQGFQSSAMTRGDLRLVAATAQLAAAELAGPHKLAALLRAEVGPGWPPGEYDRDAQQFFLERLTQGGEAAAGWYCWYALLDRGPGRSPAMVGAGGYLGPPDGQGVVEIGFSVLPAWQGQGLATAMAADLVENAFRDDRVRTVAAQTFDSNMPSRKVLEKCGFLFTGMDQASGTMRYEMSRPCTNRLPPGPESPTRRNRRPS